MAEGVFRNTAKKFIKGINSVQVIEHYDKLIEENNDPVYDPAPLKEYMDKYLSMR